MKTAVNLVKPTQLLSLPVLLFLGLWLLSCGIAGVTGWRAWQTAGGELARFEAATAACLARSSELEKDNERYAARLNLYERIAQRLEKPMALVLSEFAGRLPQGTGLHYARIEGDAAKFVVRSSDGEKVYQLSEDLLTVPDWTFSAPHRESQSSRRDLWEIDGRRNSP
ncbi:hypothetical protein [Jonquetella anthropi]|uniref:hypothetical protein n=1 Tax=Jonquetella anthropi TaxID=428712 RepID=UPI0001B90F04|nr:hypothetical protein [Jonquetella anthropi]EEX49346.1 hypothetical protein GCWU000246_00078 [Jonquetella anthropi E3_33 E1]